MQSARGEPLAPAAAPGDDEPPELLGLQEEQGERMKTRTARTRAFVDRRRRAGQ